MRLVWRSSVQKPFGFLAWGIAHVLFCASQSLMFPSTLYGEILKVRQLQQRRPTNPLDDEVSLF